MEETEDLEALGGHWERGDKGRRGRSGDAEKMTCLEVVKDMRGHRESRSEGLLLVFVIALVFFHQPFPCNLLVYTFESANEIFCIYVRTDVEA